MNPSITYGVYRHYKGYHYLVLGIASDSNADEFHSDSSRADAFSADPLFPDGRLVVVYVGLQVEAAKDGPRMHVRTLSDFNALVHLPDGSECTHVGSSSTWCGTVERVVVRRFTFVDRDWSSEMARTV